MQLSDALDGTSPLERERTHTRTRRHSASHAPRPASLLEGVAEVYPAVGIVVAMTAALNGISVMRAYFHLFTGVKHSTTGSLSCVRVERLAIIGILLLILGGGLFPQPGVSSRYEAAKDLMEHRSPTHSLPNQDKENL